MARKTKSDTIAELRAQLAHVSRSEAAFVEHFLCTTRADVRGNVGFSCAVELGGGSTTRAVVTVYGAARAAGGVAVVTWVDSEHVWNDFPVFLDDLLAIWTRSPDSWLRYASDRISQMRKDVFASLAA